MKKIPALVAICALVLPRALSAEAFEGKVSMKITSTNASKDAPQSIQYVMKEGLMKIEIATDKGQASMIMDFKNQQMLMLMPQQRMYMVQPFPQPPANQAGGSGAKDLGTEVQVTTEKANILGYECTKLVSTSSAGSAEVWVTDQLGTFMGLSPGAGGPGHRPQVVQAWEAALKGKGYFPMRVVATKGGQGTFRLEVTSVQKVSVPDSEFAPPEGWRKLDIGAMMGGALPGGFPGARPSGNN
ncbi:MAG TPA: DUF4412 domain-containing protein [Opitutaceae bacterium]|nr:DUF4412 domain-containing protein [Opitutaceae bacterium]